MEAAKDRDALQGLARPVPPRPPLDSCTVMTVAGVWTGDGRGDRVPKGPLVL